MTATRNCLLRALRVKTTALTAGCGLVFGDVGSGWGEALQTMEFRDGSVLRGNVEEFDAEALLLKSPLANRVLKIRKEEVARILFPVLGEERERYPERLTLVSEEVLPCRVRSMDEEVVVISTRYAGDFHVPRSSVRGLLFGGDEEERVFRGNVGLDSWEAEGEGWDYRDGKYICRGNGLISRQVDLSGNIRISFKLATKGKPDMIFRFFDQRDENGRVIDSYRLLLNSTSFKVARDKAELRVSDFGEIPMTREILAAGMRIDFCLNRDTREVSIDIDGVERARWKDTFDLPVGDRLSFCKVGGGFDSCEISDLEVVREAGTRRSGIAEKIKGLGTDLLLDRDGETITGKIVSIGETDSGKSMVKFQPKQSAGAIQIPLAMVRSLSFVPSNKHGRQGGDEGFRLELRGHASFLVESFTFEEKLMVCEHAFLGSLKIQRDEVVSITRVEK